MPGKAAKAFTLIEMLVAIAVVSLMMAMLLPAVQSAREAARRIQCSNNLKQIGIALNIYEATYKAFPTLSTYSTHSMLLPYLELSTTYNAINHNVETSDPTGANTTVVRVSISTFLCPSDLGWPANWTNYAGNCGVGIQKYGYNGITSRSPIGFQEVTDGSSQTAAFSEFVMGQYKGRDPRRVVYATPAFLIRPEQFDQFSEECRGLKPDADNIKEDERGATWITTSFSSSLYNHTNGINERSCTNGSLMQQGAWSAGSLHPNGANVLFADGHVRFQIDSVRLNVWRALGSRNGGEPVALE